MARFSLVFAAGVLLLVTMASATTTVTTTFEENPYGSRTGSGCYQQMMEQDMLKECGMYLMENVKGGRSQMPSRIAKSSDEQMQMCCMQLQNLGQECMCSGIKMMMNYQPMWWSMTGQMMGPMMSTAQNLPMQCKLMSQPCQMRAILF